MPRADWIDKYPGVKRLLQDNEELLYDVDGAGGEMGFAHQALTEMLTALRTPARPAIWRLEPIPASGAPRPPGVQTPRLVRPVRCPSCRAMPGMWGPDVDGNWRVSCEDCHIGTVGSAALDPDPIWAAILQWNACHGEPTTVAYVREVLAL